MGVKCKTFSTFILNYSAFSAIRTYLYVFYDFYRKKTSAENKDKFMIPTVQKKKNLKKKVGRKMVNLSDLLVWKRVAMTGPLMFSIIISKRLFTCHFFNEHTNTQHFSY